MLPFIDSLHHYTTWWLSGKESICQCRILLGSTPGLGRSPAEGNGNPLQYSCLENPMDQGAWQGTVHSVTRVRHDLGTNHHHRWRNWGTGSVYNLSKVEKGWKWQLLTYVQLCDPMDCSPPGSLVHGIFQAWILEWVAIPFFRGSSRPRDHTQVSCISRRTFFFFF